jgi:isopropylmalate/homocitrate/citramalate synthase
MAAANTLAAVQGGATQAESTLKGIGEGVGNARTEEIIPLLRMNGYDLQ